MTQEDLNVVFEPGDFLAREKMACEAIFVIKEGQLKVFKNGKDGKEIPLAVIGSGEYIGEVAFFLGTPHSSNVVALTKVKAIKLPKTVIDRQLKDTPPWLLALLKGVIRRLHNSNETIRKYNVIDDKTATAVSAFEQKSPNKKPA